MIDHASRIEHVVKDELSKACIANGIDKNEAGYAIGGFGAVAMVPVEQQGQKGFIPAAVWTVLISLRSLSLSYPTVGPSAASIPVMGVLPSDDDFRRTVRELLPQVDTVRQKELYGNYESSPGEVIR